MLQNERRNKASDTAANSTDDIDKKEIHREKFTERFAAMTKSELEQARNDLISSMSPELPVALFKKKQKNKTKAEMPLSAESVTSMAKIEIRMTWNVVLVWSSGTRIKEDAVPIVDGSDTSLAKLLRKKS